MELYPQTSIYYDYKSVNIQNLILIKEEIGNDDWYKSVVDSKFADTNEAGLFGFARICYLYKTDYKSFVNKLEKKMRRARKSGRKVEAVKAITKLELTLNSLEARHNRMTRETILAECGDEFDEEMGELAICHQAMKNYDTYEKGARFAIVGNRAKTEKYIKKLNECLSDTWCLLTDKNEEGEEFYTTEFDGTKLKNGGAFQPILDSIAEQISQLKNALTVLC